MLTVHGRTRNQNKDKVGEADWEIIRKIKEEVSMPVVSNGGISNFDDIQECLNLTGVDAVMSSEAVLEYPALF